MWAFAWAWLAYGLAETLLAIAWPAAHARWLGQHFAQHPLTTAALLLLYPLFGALLGALAARAIGERDARAPRLALLASASVMLALLANLAAQGDLGRSGVGLALAFAGALGLAARAAARGDEGWAVATPWLIAPLATASVWLLRVGLVQSGLALRLGATLALLGASLGVAWLARRALARAWRRRGALRAGALACGVLALTCALLLRDEVPALPPPALANGRPPIVLIVLDTLRADRLSAYGYAHAEDPALASFARESWLFERALAPGDMTLSSHASLFTGQFVARHGTRIGAFRLSGSALTLAERLAPSGYPALAVVANCSFLDDHHELHQGFATWDTRCARPPFAPIGGWALRDRAVEALRRTAFRERGHYEFRNARAITDEALRVAQHAAARGGPFLLFLNYMDVHHPLHPPREFRLRRPGFSRAFDMQHDWLRLDEHVNRGGGEVTAAERAHIESQYDGALAYLDTQLARLFAGLREQRLWDASLIVVTADHGEGFGDHQRFGHGTQVYQDVVGVPLLVKPPGLRAARRVATSVSLVDVAPTVLEVAGLATTAELDGVSLLGEIPENRPLFAESFDGEGPQARALLRGARKLIEHRGRAQALYDLASDPGEQRDLAGVHTDEAGVASHELAAWVQQQASGGSVKLAPEEEARLKALGYLR